MASPIINNLVLPDGRVLVLLDEDSQTTGMIAKRSPSGGGKFRVAFGGVGGSDREYDHVLFLKEMATEVIIDDVEYMAMHQNAVVGLISD